MSDKNAAFERALDYTGFGNVPDAKKLSPDEAVAAVAAAVDSTTPFLSKYINGRSVWQVTFDSLLLDLPGWVPDAVKGQVVKTYTVLIDSATGQLLRVSGYAVDGERSPAPLLSAELATKGMRGTGESISGFPDSLPEASLLVALSQAAGSRPLAVPEVHAWLVNWSDMGKPAIPVWMIIGTPIEDDMPRRVADLPPDWKPRPLRIRSIIEAATGKPRAFTSTP